MMCNKVRVFHVQVMLCLNRIFCSMVFFSILRFCDNDFVSFSSSDCSQQILALWCYRGVRY